MKIAAQGAILIGGKSRRFGRDKAFIEFDNEPISVRLYRLLKSIFKDSCLIASTLRRIPVPGAEIFYDKIPGLGPLGGLLAALANSSYPYTFILACDLPFINIRLIKHLWETRDDADVILPIYFDKIEPLAAFYHKNCIPQIEAALEDGKRKMDSFWSHLSINKIDLTKNFSAAEIEQMFLNINSKKEYKKVLQSNGSH